MDLRIAVVQLEGRHGRPAENRAKALEFAAQALEKHPSVILFHEVLMGGYTDHPREIGEALDGPSTKAFQGLLRGTDALIIYGLIEREGADCFVAAPVVSASGVVANYRKTHLWWRAEGLRHEPTYFKPGNRLVTFDIGTTRCGLMICYDGDFPEMARSYANLGCAVVFWMNNRGSRGHAEVKPLTVQNSLIIAASCCCGPNEVGEPCGGGSNITGPQGELLAEIWDTEGIIVADVRPQEVLELRERNPWYRGRRPDLYRY